LVTLQADADVAREPSEPLDILGLVAGDDPASSGGGRNNVKNSERAWKHAADMRYKKLKKTKVNVGAHAAKTISQSNESFAKTAKEVIPQDNLGQKKPPKVKGKGRHKTWLPSAILRACFGLPNSWVTLENC